MRTTAVTRIRQMMIESSCRTPAARSMDNACEDPHIAAQSAWQAQRTMRLRQSTSLNWTDMSAHDAVRPGHDA